MTETFTGIYKREHWEDTARLLGTFNNGQGAPTNIVMSFAYNFQADNSKFSIVWFLDAIAEYGKLQKQLLKGAATAP
jgi:hypothetical protein